jgi:hypothetical protein
MTKRTIETTIGTYVGKRGGEPFFGAYGRQGDEVDVHEDYVDEFDAVNVKNGDGEPVEYERVGVDVVSPDTADKKKAPAKKAT